jgi:hypothetical protein
MNFIDKIKRPAILILMLGLMPAAGLLSQPSKLVVIDTLVTNEYKNLYGYDSTTKILILPGEGNPLEIIASELGKSDYSEIHIFALTKPGSIIFDELNLIPETIQEYSEDLTRWKTLIKPGTRIVIHSETLTDGPEGSILLDKIAEFTGTNVTISK